MGFGATLFILCTLAVPITFVVALVLSFTTKRQPLRHNARLTAGILGAILVLAPLSLWLLFRIVFGPSPPSLTDLQKSFPKQRDDLETILRLSDEDPQYSRIDPTFARKFPTVDPATGEITTEATLPAARWNQYRTVFSKNDIRQGIERDLAGDAFIRVQSEGLLNRGHGSGYVYCNPAPHPAEPDTFRYEPCSSSKDADTHPNSGNHIDEGYSFQKLADHWYAYDKGPG